MTSRKHPQGVFAAIVTPLNADFSLDFDTIQPLFSFLFQRGCHGGLLFGTTGEGPSFAPDERMAFMRRAIQARQTIPDFQLLAGTGTPSLEETIVLTRTAFDLGFNGVVVLPPYYYKKIEEEGLFLWFSQVIQKAVPSDGSFFAYHIPAISGITISHDLLARLKDTFPNQFAGIKDSTGDVENSRLLGERFGDDLVVFTGNDKLMSKALSNHASGCITAMANICSTDLRTIWDAHQNRISKNDVQYRLNALRKVMDQYPPAPGFIKAMLTNRFGFPHWNVRPPLLPLPEPVFRQALTEWDAIDHVGCE